MSTALKEIFKWASCGKQEMLSLLKMVKEEKDRSRVWRMLCFNSDFPVERCTSGFLDKIKVFRLIRVRNTSTCSEEIPF